MKVNIEDLKDTISTQITRAKKKRDLNEKPSLCKYSYWDGRRQGLELVLNEIKLTEEVTNDE